MLDNKKAYVVVGPESSGTRMLTDIFISAGAWGDSTHQQKLDKILTSGEPIPSSRIVIRRSFPHSRQWPSLKELTSQLKQRGFEVLVIVIVRSLQYTCLSTQRQGHAKSEGAALRRSLSAIKNIFLQLEEESLPFVWVTYESLVKHTSNELSWLMGVCDLPVPEALYLFDANERYLKTDSA